MRETPKKRLFIVLGMHRSGTSAITRALPVLGVELGDRLMPSAEGNNDKGFWEDIDLNELNIEMLKLLSSDWSYLTTVTPDHVARLRQQGYFLRAVELMRKKTGSVAYLGLKDPRVAKLMPFWREVFAHCQLDVSYIVALRHPLSVARSLDKRDGMISEQSYLLWLGHVLSGLVNTEGRPCVVVDYDRLMQDSNGEIARVARVLDLQIDQAALQSYQREFLDQALRHSVYAADDLLIDHSCPRLVHEVYAALLDVACDRQHLQDPALQQKIQVWAAQYQLLEPSLRLADKLLDQKTAAVLQGWEHQARLHAAQASYDEQVVAQQQAIGERDARLVALEGAVGERDARLAGLEELIKLREAQVSQLEQAVADGERQIVHARELVAQQLARAAALANASTAFAMQQERAEQAEQHVQSQREQLTQREALIAELRASTSWRLTGPLRFVATQAYRTRRAVSLIGPALRVGGGASGTARRALRLYRNEGWSGIKRGLRIAASAGQVVPTPGSDSFHRNDYTEWVRRYDNLDMPRRQRLLQRIAAFSQQPLISVLMPVYNTPTVYLEQAIASVRAQLYGNWELCIADDASTAPEVRQLLQAAAAADARIKVVHRERNGHISAASNSALELASGSFVALLDHDDLLAPLALYRIVEAINAHPDALLIYSDEDKIDVAGHRYEPYFKSDFNYELLLAQNMISHLGVYRTSLLRELGGFRVGYEGAQDYDLALRVVERAAPAQIVHVPYVLYHWRAIAGSTALDEGEKDYAAEAGRKAVAEHLARRGLTAEVLPAPEGPSLNRVRFACPSPQPLVSIIIPTRDRADLLGMCLDSLIERTSYQNYEVIIVDNGSTEQATADLFARLPKDRFRILRDESPFSFSALNNHAAREARGTLLCLMNNDIEILTPDWLEEMVSFASQPEIGCVGARLWYPDGRLQHGGVIIGLGGVAGHAHKYFPKGDPGYFRRAVLHQSLSAVTAACLLLRREIYEQVDGLDVGLAVAFNDIDFCLRVREAGYRNVWTPYAEMVHHESASRGLEDSPAKQARFAAEVQFVQARWGRSLREDPAYSVNLTLDSEDYAYAWPPRSDWQ